MHTKFHDEFLNQKVLLERYKRLNKIFKTFFKVLNNFAKVFEDIFEYNS